MAYSCPTMRDTKHWERFCGNQLAHTNYPFLASIFSQFFSNFVDPSIKNMVGEIGLLLVPRAPKTSDPQRYVGTANWVAIGSGSGHSANIRSML